MKTSKELERWVSSRTWLYRAFMTLVLLALVSVLWDKVILYSYRILLRPVLLEPLIDVLWCRWLSGQMSILFQDCCRTDFAVAGITACLDVAGLFVACRYLWGCYKLRRRVEVCATTSCLCADVCAQIASDAPIKRKSEDLYSRGACVEALSNIILSHCSKDAAAYVGIYGAWGDGKTSVRYLAEEFINEVYGHGKALFIDFSPWEYSDSCDLRMELFEKVARVLSRTGMREVSFTFSQLAKFFSLRRSNRRMGLLQDVIDVFRGFWFSYVVKEDDLIDAVKIALANVSQRIVIVIDDLERLTKNDVGRVIRFLKANGDLPNLVYLILTDEDYLASAVSEMVGCPNGSGIDVGREYLQKIITIPYRLPDIDGNKLLKNFIAGVKSLLDSYGIRVDNPEDGCEWAAYYLENPRKVKLLLNSFSVRLARHKVHVGDAQYLNVHIGDLLALTALEFGAPDVYKHLQDGYVGLLCNTSWQFGSGKGVLDEGMNQMFYDYLTGDKREHFKQFLEGRLGVVSEGGTEYDKKPRRYRLKNPDDAELMLNYRLASRFCFANYFVSDNDGMIVSQQDIESFKSNINAGKFPENIIARLNEEGKLPTFLYALNGIEVFSTLESSNCYLRTLVKMAALQLKPINYERSPTNIGAIIRPTIYSRIYSCLSAYNKKLMDEIACNKRIFGEDVETAGEFLLPILHEEKDVVLTAHLIASDAKYHNGGDYENCCGAIFTHDGYEQLRGDYINFIEEFQTQGRLFGHEDFSDLFRCWRTLLKKYDDDKLYARFRSACMSAVRNMTTLSKILVFFADDNRYSEDEEDFIVTVRIDDLERSFGKKGLDTIIKVLESSANMSEYDFKILTVLRWARIQKEARCPYDVDAQEEYLRQELETREFKDEMFGKTGVIHRARKRV